MNKLKLIALLLAIKCNVYSANPVGNLDNVSIDANGGVNGWALDLDAPSTSINVAFYIYDANNYLLTSGIKPTNVYRADVNTKMSVTGNHGFSFSIPTIYLNKTIFISAGNVGPGQDVLIPGPAQGKTIKLKSDLLYSTYIDPITNRILAADVYRPITNPANKKLPLIVLVHGGGFVNGCKQHFDYNSYARNMANADNGYVVASIDYRLMGTSNPAVNCFGPTSINTTNLCKDNILNNQAWYWSIQDLNAAIKFLIYNNATYNLNIDTSKIFLYGESAGAITVLSLAYASQQEIYNEFGGAAVFTDPYLGPIDKVTNSNCKSVQYKIAGVGAVAGAVAKASFIGTNETVPVVMLHNPCDNLVTAESTPTNFASMTNPSQSLCMAYLYGSRYIIDKFDQYKISGYQVPYHHLYAICDYPNVSTDPQGHKFGPTDVNVFAGTHFMDFVKKITANTSFPIIPSVTALTTPSTTINCTPALKCLNYYGRFANNGNGNNSIVKNEESKVSFLPNPTTNAVKINANAISCSKVDICLYNLQGQILYKKTATPSSKNSIVEIISLTSFTSGTYIIILKGKNYYKKEIIIKQ